MTVTPLGDFNRINNLGSFERILVEQRQAEIGDPAKVFSSAYPGFLSRICEVTGPWPGRSHVSWEFNGKGEKARVVGTRESMELGGYDKKRIVALPGPKLAGHSQYVHQEDLAYGMTAADASRKAALPLLEFNRTVAESLLDVVHQGAKFAGATFANDFAWRANDLRGQSIVQDIITDDANQVPTVVANDSQTLLWPKRDGTEFTAGHDHMLDEGGDITKAKIETAIGALREHPGVGIKVDAYVGKNVIDDVVALAVADYGAISERIHFQHQVAATGGDFCDFSLRVEEYKDVNWYFSPDINDDYGIYVPRGQKPFYLSIGSSKEGGLVDVGSWSRPDTDPEKGSGITYGHRSHVTMGVQNPIGVFIAEYKA